MRLAPEVVWARFEAMGEAGVLMAAQGSKKVAAEVAMALPSSLLKVPSILKVFVRSEAELVVSCRSVEAVWVSNARCPAAIANWSV